MHRDVKPANVLVGEHGAVKLGDLGLATAAEITRITPPGSILGTPAYMAPEQAQPVPCTPATDIYALATIAFQALSGTLPRTGSTALAVLRQAASMPPPDLRERRPGTPAAAAEALSRGMALEPDERPASASALLDELEAGLRAAATRAGRPSAPGRCARPRAAARPRTSSPPAARPRHRRGAARRRGCSPCSRSPRPPRRSSPCCCSRATRRRASRPRARREPTGEATAEATAERTTEEPAPAATPRALSPAATVRAFYERAAEDDFAGAWRLAGPGMRAVYGGSRAEFERQLGSLERIEFPELALEGRSGSTATVRVSTVATHTDRVDRCSGTLRTVRSGGRWQVEPAGLQCCAGLTLARAKRLSVRSALMPCRCSRQTR